jgi:hypothetical protein
MSRPSTRCTPCGKDSYGSYEAAARGALEIKTRPTTQLTAYPCPINDDVWHLSTRPTARGLRRAA